MSETMPVHLSGYQSRDYDVVDYAMYCLADTGLQFRGPAVSDQQMEAGNYFTCVGAAQTFGCLCESPFPSQLATQLDLPALNLGYGGAGPEFFAGQPSLLQYANRGKFLILQVMSGRSQSNSVFDSGGLEYLTRRSDGANLGAQAAYRQLMAGDPRIRQLPLRRLSGFAARMFARPKVKRIVAETRAAWVESYQRLLAQIDVPTVLLWFSVRTPDYQENYRRPRDLFGEFPQLVNEDMVSQVRSICDHYVEVVTRRGMPQRLISRFTGKPVVIQPGKDRADLGAAGEWTVNDYYPTPEMHVDATSGLLPVCRRLRETSESQL